MDTRPKVSVFIPEGVYKTPKQRAGRRYFLKNRWKCVQASIRWQKENPLKARITSKKAGAIYIQTAKGIYAILKKRSKIKGKTLDIDKESFITWYNNQEQECHYCGTDYNGGRRMEIDRRDNSQWYTIKNMVLACNVCNSVKCNLLTESEMLLVGQIIKKRYA